MPVLRQILYNRGFRERGLASAFLEARVTHSTDPFQLMGMSVAVNRLLRALADGERIAVYGDYDTDGVTATALLVEALRALGGQVEGFIPSRFEEGYGLTNDALLSLKEKGTSVVVSVDCGIRSLAEAAYASEIGLDLIVTDHHHPGPALPEAVAVINPKQPGDPYGYKDMAGVGLAYKLAEALFARASEVGLKPTVPLDSFLDLVALGTVADLAPVTGENRALIRAGLKHLNAPARPGVRSLFHVARVAPGSITATTIGFTLGPRLNAAGRLDSALAAFELLTTRDGGKAAKLAEGLEAQNRERQEMTRALQARVREMIGERGGADHLIFAAHPDFNRGVVGLVASRILDEFYRPVIVAEQGESETIGSARSIPEYHITQALDQCADLLIRHGGHEAAAGFKVRNENLDALAERMRTLAANKLAEQDLRPSLQIDAVVRLSGLDWALLESLAQLEPVGMSNPAPILAVRNARVASSRQVGSDGSHLKLVLTDGWISIDAIAFRQGHWAKLFPEQVDVAFTFESNEWNGEKRLQLNVKAIKRPGDSEG